MKHTLVFSIVFAVLALIAGAIAFLPGAGHQAFVSLLCLILSGVAYMSYISEKRSENIARLKWKQSLRGRAQ